jgi:hypothetical protein
MDNANLRAEQHKVVLDTLLALARAMKALREGRAAAADIALVDAMTRLAELMPGA